MQISNRKEILTCTLLAIIQALLFQEAFGEERYHIVPVNSTSLCQQYPNGTCFTLDTFSIFYVGNIEHQITLSFLPGEHLLTRNMAFSDMQTINLINAQQYTIISPRISCVENTGLYVNNTGTLLMKGLIIYGCVNKGPVIEVQNIMKFHMQDCKFIENYNPWKECSYVGIIQIMKTNMAVITNTSYTNNKNMCGFQLSSIFYAENSEIVMNLCLFDNSKIEESNITGCAISLTNSTGYITNTTFLSNRVEEYGAAIYMNDSRVNITYTIFENNQARKSGGAIAMFSSTAYITCTIFLNNQAQQLGGAIAMIKGSRGYITNANFSRNKAKMYHGGAIMGTLESIGNITNTVFEKNEAGQGGGAVHFDSINVTHSRAYLITSRCIFKNNLAKFFGGAISALRLTLLDHNTKYLPIFKSSGNVYKGNQILLNENSISGGAVYTTVSSLFENDYYMENTGQYGAVLKFSGPFIFIIVNNCYFTANGKNGKPQDIDLYLVLGYQISANITNITMVNNRNQAFAAFESDVTFYGYNRFINNTWAVNGGAVYATSSILTFDESSTTDIIGNKGSLVGGMYLFKSKLNGHGDVIIANNIAMKSGGGIYAIQSEVLFQGKNGALCETNNINIMNNAAQKNGGGMYLSDTTVTIQDSNITISGNHAQQFGGGLSFAENSNIIVKCDQGTLRHAFLYIKNNSALRGGGVYVNDRTNSQQYCFETNEQPCFLSSDICSKRNPHECGDQIKYTYFENNKAIVTGSDIYGGMLETCRAWLENSTNGILYVTNNVSWTWGNEHYDIIKNKTTLFNHVSSDPVKLCSCVGNITYDCTFTSTYVHKKKGETFTLSIVVVDQMGKPVNSRLFSLLNQNGGSGRLKAGQQIRELRDQCTQLEYNVYHSQSKAVLELYPDGPCGNEGLSKRTVNITFDPCTCPLGFEQQHDPIDCFCDCTEALKPYIESCWPKESIFELNNNNWIMNINNTGFVIHNCPFDFCLKEHVNISLYESSDIQCAFNRTRILCGKCDEGLSMVFATSQCQQCSNYYLFLLLPFGIAGVALVAFLLILNITVATGTIHGLIFYANILAANRSVFLPFDNVNILTVFVSWLNLDLGIETCFYNGLDPYGKLMLQLVFPAYVFSLILSVMVLCDRSQRIAGFFGKRNPEATLYTLFLLSYSKLIRTIITAFQYTTLDYPDGSKEIVWLYDGNVRYFALNHIPRFLVAFIILILGAVYTSLLLFGQLFNKCSEYRVMKWTSHKYYIHFMKAHHAPLSDNHRYWVGLLLLARLMHYLTSAFVDDFRVIFSVLIITLFLLLHKVIFDSYTKKSLNLLDTFFTANLLVLAGATFFVQLSGGDQQALTMVSMSFSFIAFVGIVLYHILENCGIKMKNILVTMIPTLREEQDIDYRPIAIVESEDDSNPDERDEELRELSTVPEDRAPVEPQEPTRYITPPVIQPALPADRLREPALDDLCPLTPADYNAQRAAPPTAGKQVPTVTEIVITN